MRIITIFYQAYIYPHCTSINHISTPTSPASTACHKILSIISTPTALVSTITRFHQLYLFPLLHLYQSSEDSINCISINSASSSIITILSIIYLPLVHPNPSSRDSINHYLSLPSLVSIPHYYKHIICSHRYRYDIFPSSQIHHV